MQRESVGDREDGAIELRGELDAYSAPTADAALAELPSGRDGIVDMSAVTFVDSAGLRVLVHHSSRLRDGGGRLHLRGVNDGLRRLIDLTGLQAAFVVN